MKKSVVLIILISVSIATYNRFGSLNLFTTLDSESSAAPHAGRGATSCQRRQVVFDSNRSGTFGIYAACLDGSGLRTLIDASDTHELYPDPSPDGRYIVFARASDPRRYAPANLWLFDRKDNSQRLIVENATFPSFVNKGKSIIFERERKAVFLFDIADESERQIFPWPDSSFDQHVLAKPRISEDLTWLYFTSEVPLRWNSWKVNLKTGQAQRIGHGCQSNPLNNSYDAVWVQKRSDGSGTDILKFNKETGSSELLQFSGKNTFAYYPELDTDSDLLLYSHCRGCTQKTNSHENGPYEIVALDLKDNRILEITKESSSTNRWPKLLP